MELQLGPEADSAEKLSLVNDGFGDHDVAIARGEYCFRRRHEFELSVPYIFATVGGKEFAVAVVDAGEGDTILGF